MKRILVSTALLFFINLTLVAQESGYHVTDTFHIASNGWWDYLAVNNNKLYVSHGTQVNILNEKNGDSIGVILNTTGVHGIAFVNNLNKGFTSNGGLNNVTVFNLATNKILGHIATGNNPDAIFYDDYSKKIITCNGRSQSLSIIDPYTDKVVQTIPLSGKPETAVSDGRGHVFVNIENKSAISKINIRNYKVEETWPIARGESPSGLSIDRKTNRLFAGCQNQMMIVLDAENGKVVSTPAIGKGCDGTAFDPGLHYAFSSNGEGTLTVIKEVSKDQFDVIDNVPTKRGARTNALDVHTHAIYLPTADFGPAVNGERRPPMIPGSFQVLVVKRK